MDFWEFRLHRLNVYERLGSCYNGIINFSKKMSSAICQNFVQNAWKKELCSNCFKSKDEHILKPKFKPITVLSNKKVDSIIKNGRKSKPKMSVCFLKDLTEIIGVGGEEWGSDEDTDEEDDDSNDTSEEDFTAESDEEDAVKELQRITKENTDFNANSLADIIEVKKSYTQLLLGKPLVDSEGRKQTLMVSVTPFGEDSTAPAKKYSKTSSNTPLAKNNKETLVETKTNVVLTSYTKNEENKTEKEEKSLLDEITETLENSKNPIQIISRKKTQKEIVLTVSKSDANKENIVDSNTTKIEEVKATNEEKPNENKSLVKTTLPERRIGLTRAPALKRDQEKPVIYQTSTAKIELLNSRNLKLSKELANKNNDIKNEVNNNNEKTDSVLVDNEQLENKTVDITKVTSDLKLSCAESKGNNNNDSKTVVSETKDKKEDVKIDAFTEAMPVNQKITGLPPPVPKFTNINLSISREQAGEPDGRADPDGTNEPPALPLTPPPILETQTSFLHAPVPIYEKPKVPCKPSTVLIRKTIQQNPPLTLSPTLTTFASEIKEPEIQKVTLSKQDSDGSDVALRTLNKRRAPRPPEDSSPVIFTRNSTSSASSDSPVVREKDKRDRASSCTPKMYYVSSNPQGDSDYGDLPEPAPRKSLSISTDSLASTGNEERRKEKSKARFSLKKFLRMGSSKDLPKVPVEPIKTEDDLQPPQPKPRLVIVHPSELNGSKVQVVAKSADDQPDYPRLIKQESLIHNNGDYEVYSSKTTKPPPPPRNLEDTNRISKPSVPHPPKSVEILNKQRQIQRNNFNNRKVETVYANIGEVRSAIVPNKPQRTASMREREAQQQKQLRKHLDGYESIHLPSKGPGENVYDYINNSGRSSSPDSDSSREKNSPTTAKNLRLNKRSESSIDVSGEYFKFNNIPRSVSLTYCGSETESEIYAPYSFYGSESEVTEDDHDWLPNGRTHKLRSKKGRSIVHKNLEDNYGAVVVANHEALAQVLENIQQVSHVQPAFRGLKTSPNLRWSDFSIKSSTQPVTVGQRVFHQAVWGSQHVTLLVNVGTVSSCTLSLGTFSLPSVTEFSDLIPNNYIPLDGSDDNKQIQVTVVVLPWLQVNTIQSFSESLKTKAIQTHEDTWKEASFILLQLVNALKTLQAQGIEELPVSLKSFVLCKDMDKESNYRLCVLQGLGSEASNEKLGTLCMCASKALITLQPTAKITPLIQSLLSNERAVSLTQVKSVLEFSLWGPSDVALGSTIRERELAIQRWLDLQRATVLHGLVCTRVQLTVYEECHLLFLVRSNARMMCDASLLIESSNATNKHSLSSNHK